MSIWRARRHPRTTIFLAAGAAILVALTDPGVAQNRNIGELYQATAIVTGVDMRSRPAGFAQCLRDVLVKLSGEPRLRNDPRVTALAARADTFVASFNYVDQVAGRPIHDDQGTYDRSYNLTVRFDSTRIDQALADLGEKPWLDARPVIVPVLKVRGFAGEYLLSAENPAGAQQRAAFDNVARDHAMRLRIPTESDLKSWGVAVTGGPVSEITPPQGQVLVAGTLEFQESTPGWEGSWHMRWHGADYAWRISGVNYDEAFRDIVRGVVRVTSGHGAPN